MFSPINIAILILWTVSALFDYLGNIYIWQLKEYRTDRFRDFLATTKAKQFFFRYPLLWRSILAIVIFLWPINSVLFIKYIIIVIFSGDVLYGVGRYLKKRLLRPHITVKTLGILLISMLIEGVLFLYTRDWTALLLLVILRFFITTAVVYIASKPTQWAKKYYITQATKKMARYNNLTVIGITGSYGKTTVKEFLAHILSSSKRVIKTPKHVNTEIGIARFILQNNFSDTDIFVVEMGAYRKGEIALICNIVQPTIAILTAINEQHLSLFGSIQNTQEAKFELLRSLPKNGLAVVNSDNKHIREKLNTLECRIETFGMDEEFDPSFLIHGLKKVQGGMCFVGTATRSSGTKEVFEIILPFMGDHQAMNVAPCIITGIELGVEKKNLIQQASTLALLDGSLNVYKYGKAVIIDDSYNSNPKGFKAALDVLSKYPSQKPRLVITRGMLELGERSNELHEEIAGEISFIANEVVLISPDSADAMKRGLVKKYSVDLKEIFDQKQLLTYVRKLKDREVVILLENRLPALVHKEIKKG